VIDSELLTAIDADAQAKAMADAGNDAGCAARVTAIAPPVAGAVSPGDLLRWGAKSGVRATIETHVADPNVGAICLSVRDMLSTGTIPLDTANPDNLLMLGALVAVGAMTPAQRDSLIALGAAPVFVSPADVSRVYAVRRTNGRVS
jgi:hypothetical protein